MAPRAVRKIEHVQAQGAGFGVVDQQAGVVQAEGAAQGRGDGLKQLARRQAADHRVVDFEQRAQAVALARQLLFVGRGRFRVERVIHRHGHLARHLPHEFDVFRGVGVPGQRAEVQAAEIALRGEQRQDAEPTGFRWRAADRG